MKTIWGLTIAMVLCMNAWASDVSLPNSFSSGMPARAAEVNANFSAVKMAVDDNNARMTALETQIATLQTSLTNANNTISTLQSDLTTANGTIAILQSQISAINNSGIMALDPYVTVANDSRGPIATFSGINLQLVNGTGTTDGTPNGLGNFIIGYDVARNDGRYFCSLGQYTNQTDCVSTGGIWAVSHKNGSHYLIIGDQDNYSQYGALVVGFKNTSNNMYASVSGGYNNIARGNSASVSGGFNNTASGDGARVSGGAANTASSLGASVSGGFNNTASDRYASVSGGYSNNASIDFSSILGGIDQMTSFNYQTIPALP
jgi:hypothetical protein